MAILSNEIKGKSDRLILELIRATVEDKLEWKIKTPPYILSKGTDDIILAYYETTLKGQTIGIFQRRYHDLSRGHDRIFWEENIVLIFLDSNQDVIWMYSDFQFALRNLFQVVKESYFDIDGILDKILTV